MGYGIRVTRQLLIGGTYKLLGGCYWLNVECRILFNNGLLCEFSGEARNVDRAWLLWSRVVREKIGPLWLWIEHSTNLRVEAQVGLGLILE